MWGVIYLILYVIGKLTDLIYYNQLAFSLLLVSGIIVVNLFLLITEKVQKRGIDKWALSNLIVIIIGFGTLSNKALISSAILLLFDFMLIYSLLFLVKKANEYIKR
ncbi:hypothetical protein [Candidatus Enterococcus courvalinii]|uniref:Uncharacterized protein n=1 Tax=Candidatus Enterococcus courvalinii TaxID=2815329 RepID=A0ABS3HYK4_9ENTE|nr:hypothetical protein [Enterococcus sp. MSG2901]MBO0481529.1 hypothetical protein [Enterococcus sp. MSG2901]